MVAQSRNEIVRKSEKKIYSMYKINLRKEDDKMLIDYIEAQKFIFGKSPTQTIRGLFDFYMQNK